MVNGLATLHSEVKRAHCAAGAGLRESSMWEVRSAWILICLSLRVYELAGSFALEVSIFLSEVFICLFHSRIV